MDVSTVETKMVSMVEQMHNHGVELFLDGKASFPAEVAAKALCEDSSYMADFVFDDAGILEQLRYDKVTNC